MKKKAIDLIFVLLLLLFLLAGLGRTLFLPKDINLYENRYAAHAAPLSSAAWVDGSFQSGMESALADQIPGAQRLKKCYHLAFSLYNRFFAETLTKVMPDRYLNMGGMRLFNGYLCYAPFSPDAVAEPLARRRENYNAVFAAHPDTDFYLYYVEKETDLDLETGEKTPQVYETLTDGLALPEGHSACFRVNSFADYSSLYCRTDHHWNRCGSYQGYRDILAMLAPAETPLEPLEECCLGRYSGAKAEGKTRSAFSEDFYAYRFDFPETEIRINGAPAWDYGNQSAYLSGTTGVKLSYGEFYGWDDGLVELHNPGREGAGALLMLGDSFDNAVVKLLASHFEDTYAVDLRYYSVSNGRDFRLGEFLAEHGITKVLLVGNIDYYLADAFALED